MQKFFLNIIVHKFLKIYKDNHTFINDNNNSVFVKQVYHYKN